VFPNFIKRLVVVFVDGFVNTLNAEFLNTRDRSAKHKNA